MKCRENRRYLEAFLDGELDAEANLKVLEHLNLCSECNGTFEAEKGLRAALRDRASGNCCPRELAAQVCAAMDGLDRSERRRWILPAVCATAAAIIATIVTAALVAPRKRPVEEREMAALAIQFHDGFHVASSGQAICLRCEDDPRQACAKFFGKTPACHPVLDGFKYRSATMAPIRGELICWTVQECTEGSKTLISHADVPAGSVRQAEARDGWHRYDIGPRSVLMRRSGDRICLFVLDTHQAADRLTPLLKR